MEKLWKWAKQWPFIAALLVMGILDLSVTGNWDVYFKTKEVPVVSVHLSIPVTGTPQPLATLGPIADMQVSQPVVTPIPIEVMPAPVTPTATPVPVAPASTPVPAAPASTPVPAAPASTPVPATPAPTPVPATPAPTPVPATPAATPIPVTPVPAPGETSPTPGTAPAGGAEAAPGTSPAGGTEAAPGPVSMAVGDDYFTDAVFLGDSRTVGLYAYGGLKEVSTFYAATGLNIYKMFDATIDETVDSGKATTIEEALQQRKFAKIYLMIGINEMGTGTVESFMEEYAEAVAHLRELQPDAIIYLQGIMKVTTERSQRGDYIHNEGIEERNAEIAKLADNETIFYLDVNPAICDETGGMVADYTFDGVHLKAQYTAIWKDFLKTHAVVR